MGAGRASVGAMPRWAVQCRNGAEDCACLGVGGQPRVELELGGVGQAVSVLVQPRQEPCGVREAATGAGGGQRG